MKRANTIIIVLCTLLVATNTLLVFSYNSKLDKLNRRLDGLEAELAGLRSSLSNFNNVQETAEVKQKEILTPSELAQYLGVEMSKIYDMIDKDGAGLPYVNIDGEYRFGKEAIDDWLKTSKDIIIGN